ncbi:MAG: acyltransferase family protein, partial [Mucilaginibacter sp.]
MKRIPSLDGFRALSIILVLLAHSRLSVGFPHKYAEIVMHGAVGVTVFFVISGFLITTLLLSEDAEDGSINLKSFYIRRAFRILPVFFLYTLFVSIWRNFENIGLTNNDILHALTFTVNFAHQKGSWFIGHFWTLSIEEQFYLIWPTIFILFRKHLKSILLILILYSCISRVIAYKLPLYTTLILAPYFSYSDAIMIGALGGILFFEHPEIINLKAFRSYFLQFIALLLIASFVYFSAYGKLGIIALPFGNLIISVSILFLLFCYLKPSDRLVYRFLNHKAIVHIGVLSYSLYIWQQFFIIGSFNVTWRVFP